MLPKASTDTAEPRERLGEDLRAIPNGLERLLDAVMDAVVVIDDERRVTLFNRAAEAAFRCPSTAILGEPLTRLMSERFQELLDVSMREFVQSQWTRHYMWADRLTAFRADGSAFPIDVSLSPFTVDGRRQVALILRDAAIRQRGERELREVRRENARLRQDCTRYQALCRAAQRTLGMPAPAAPEGQEKRRRKRRSTARGLRMAEGLKAGTEPAGPTPGPRRPEG